jgi:DNA-binding response OmpR family regulator
LTANSRVRVFLVEDEVLITLLLEDMLVALGHEVAVGAGNLDEAIAAAKIRDFNVALVDLNLGGKLTYPVVDILKARGTPFAFVTGYGSGSILMDYSEAPVLEKPFRQEHLDAVIAQLLADLPRT